MQSQTPKICNWCGKFIVAVNLGQQAGALRTFELYTDEAGRLVRDENDLFALRGEHKCRVLCSSCGQAVILDVGNLYDRPSFDAASASLREVETVLIESRKPHHCAKR